LRTRKLGNLIGYSLLARDGEIGKLEQIYFDDQRWTVRYLVVHTGGWLLGREVLIAPRSVTGVDPEHRCLAVDLTRDKVRNSPSVESQKPVSRYYEEQFFRYYEWERYWITDVLSGVPGSSAEERPPKDAFSEKPVHPSLRSSDEVRGYSIDAIDGDIGHVEDFILEKPGWTIRYLEIDTRDWLPGKHVLVSPAWIRQVSWAKREVTVDLDREAIRTAPDYDPSKVIGRDYEVELLKHYGMPVDQE